jgi:hypothetical protein
LSDACNDLANLDAQVAGFVTLMTKVQAVVTALGA